MRTQNYGSQFDKFLMPIDSPIAAGTPQTTRVPWEFGVKQGIQSKKVRSSIGQFNKLSGTTSNQNLTGGTVSQSLFSSGTIQTSIFSGTISQPVSSGGTFTNPTDNTGTYNTSLFANGTFNNGTIGTSLLIGGTIDASLFKHNGTVGVDGTAIYVKTIDFVGGTYTVGTIITQKGIITSIN